MGRREVNWPSRIHSVCKWESWDPNQSSLVPGPVRHYLTILLRTLFQLEHNYPVLGDIWLQLIREASATNVTETFSTFIFFTLFNDMKQMVAGCQTVCPLSFLPLLPTPLFKISSLYYFGERAIFLFIP